MTLTIDKIPNGPIDTICYVISNAEGSAVVIDPGSDPEKIIMRIQAKSINPVALLLTHGHYDHIEGVNALKSVFAVPVMGAQADGFLFETGVQSAYVGRLIEAVKLDEKLMDGQELDLIGATWRVIATPGHSPGSLTFLVDKFAFTGDTLFASGGVGRTDLWEGSLKDLKFSIEKKLFCLPEETIIYPGHGNHSTIGQEKLIHYQLNI